MVVNLRKTYCTKFMGKHVFIQGLNNYRYTSQYYGTKVVRTNKNSLAC